jgi:hypothetical protein
MPSYPAAFDLALLRGSRAKQFADPSDAFQQLVGESLQEIGGSDVHVTATKGRDGGIDVHTAAGILDLEGPTIVEAKAHQESDRLWDNVVSGWRAVQQTLGTAAAKGWPRPHDPWRSCRSYAYCVAARLNPSQIEDLETRIRSFLSGLPPDCRPPVERVRVLDWSDLRPYLDSAVRSRDFWLGLGSTSLAAHEDFRRDLSGFRRYLLGTHLPYHPLRDRRYRPEAILDRLTGFQGERGLLVVGPGGVGKTRLAMEVAEIAHQRGDRVLHALPGEPLLTSEHLMEAVLEGRGGPTTVLVLFDYLDQMDGLDLGVLQRHLVPQAKERRLNLLLLANARPGEEKPGRTDTAVRLGLFDTLTLEVEREEGEQLSSHVVGAVAPTALSELGLDRLSALCGSRPIIAMLTAREVERRVEAGAEEAKILAGLTSPDLLSWLRLRLRSGGLSVPEARGFNFPEIELPIIAAAAVLAAAPQTQSGLRELAGKVLRDSAKADFVVDQLFSLGWLELDGRSYSTPHDVVADEVLDQVLRLRPQRILRRQALTAILSAGEQFPRSLGRFSIALRRLLSRGDEAPVGLEEASGKWLAERANIIGDTLAASDSDESAYALGAVLAWPPWLEASLAEWRVLVQPWLRLHGTSHAARHILHRGLKFLASGEATELTQVALEWRREHGGTIEAGFVLAPLLGRDDLAAAELEQARAWALEWRGEHGRTTEAQFVLHPLLKHEDLAAAESEQARGWALEWRREHWRTIEARFVLNPLLKREDLAAAESEQARAWALEWREEHGGTKEAGFVLPPLLGREDLAAAESEQARAWALEWRGEHGGTIEAGFVLAPLLGREDLATTESEQARAWALEWRGEHGRTTEAQFVLHPLLKREDLTAAESKRARAWALEWRGEHGRTIEAGFVLAPLLGREDLAVIESEQAQAWALEWRGKHGRTIGAQFILHSLLKREDLADAESEQARAWALEWLEGKEQVLSSCYVFPPLLTRADVTDQELELAVETALDWMGVHRETEDASYVLRGLLWHDDLGMSHQVPVWKLAIEWCGEHLCRLDLDYVLKKLIRNRRIPDLLWARAATLAVGWLRRTPQTSDRDHILYGLVLRPVLLSAEDQEWLIHDALSWLEIFDPDASAFALRSRLCDLLPPDRFEEWELDQVQAILDRFPDAVGAPLARLLPLTARSGLTDVHHAVFQLTQTWLRRSDLKPASRHRFRTACLDALEWGRWPRRDLGERALAALGLIDPPA